MFTLIMPQQWVLFTCDVIATPIYTLEFILVYSLKIKYVQELSFIQKYGHMLNYEL